MNWKKWISIAAAVCLAVTAVPMRAVAQEELVQEKMLEELKEEQQEELKEEKEEPKEEKEEKEELKEEKEEKEKLQEQSDEKTEPQEESKKELLKGISLLMEEENSTAVSEKVAADFEGKGTAANPYKIQNVDDLKLLAEKVNGGEAYEGKHFKLTANIDLKNEEWTPIGTLQGEEVRPFQGTFDGDGYQITNLKISNGGQYAGLFGHTEGAVIKSCNVTGKINGYNYTGGIVGYADANTKILNCSFQGNVKGKGEGRGGIVGYMSGGGEVSGCFVTGTVTGDKEVGGIAGYGVGTIKNCYALANVTATATATATGVNAGGIAGYAYGVTIENCYYSGEVSAKNYAGGIAGTAWRGTIQNCVSLAESVSGSDYVNRIAGYNYNATLTNNYAWDGTTINGNPVSADDAGWVNGAALTYTNGELSEQFSDIFKDTDSAWDFTDNGLPILKNVGGVQFSELPKCMTGVGFDGFGIKTNPYLIEDVEDLKLLAEKVNSGTTYEKTYFKQTADIDLNNEPWTPIGTVIVINNGKDARPFKGTFDGDGYKITNLKVTGNSNNAGLFGYTQDATIKNCNVTGEVSGSSDVGGIVGNADGKTQILSCSFRGDVTGEDSYIGGIAGSARGTIKNCYALADVTASFVDAGGIAGYAYHVTIENCYYSGNVSAGNDAGGIAGFASGSTIKNCVSLAKSVTGSENVNRILGDVSKVENVTLTSNYGYNRTKLVVYEKEDYADGKDEKDGTNVFVSAGKLMTDVPNQILFDWEANGFTTANGWSIPIDAYKLPSLREGVYPDLPNLPEEPVPTKKRSGGGGSTATPTYTAQFDTNGGSAVIEIKTDKNGKIEKPADPTKEGYIFVGWYSDSKLTKPFDFNAELTANSTLYAKWKENNEIILTIGSQKISVFGREIKNDVAPKIVNDRTMLPIRIVAESLGGTVTWNGELQRVTIQKGADVILITIGADTAYVNGTAVKLDAAAFVENGRTYLPLRFVSETLGAQVAWNEAEKTVTITK